MIGLQGVRATPRLQLYGLGGSVPALRPPLLGVTNAAPEVRLPRLVAPSGRTVKESVKKAAVVLAPDDSGSRWGSFGTDPSDMRDAAARSLLTLLRKSGGGRAGVVRWGGDVGVVQPIVDVLTGRKALERALSAPVNLGGTNMAPALARVAAELAAVPSDVVPIVFIITDGVCDPGVSVDAGIAALPPSCVHIVLQDIGNYCTAETEEAWRLTAAGSVTRLTTCDTTTTALAMVNVFANSVGLALASAAVPTSTKI